MTDDPKETWGVFHLRATIGTTYVSTMWDGVDRPAGPYETVVFFDPPEDRPRIHYKTRDDARAAHAEICALVARLNELGAM